MGYSRDFSQWTRNGAVVMARSRSQLPLAATLASSHFQEPRWQTLLSARASAPFPARPRSRAQASFQAPARATRPTTTMAAEAAALPAPGRPVPAGRAAPPAPRNSRRTSWIPTRSRRALRRRACSKPTIGRAASPGCASWESRPSAATRVSSASATTPSSTTWWTVRSCFPYPHATSGSPRADRTRTTPTCSSPASRPSSNP
jgi:hypothetical protein